MYPVILLCGQASSGKDTIGSFIVKNHNAVAIALADPMKRLAKIVFDFDEDQLWGPSESRNKPDLSYRNAECWQNARQRLFKSAYAWCREVSGGDAMAPKLQVWFESLDQEPITPRKVLQEIGTQLGREFNQDIWINYAIRTANKLLGGGYIYNRLYGIAEAPPITDPLLAKPDPEWVVITDGRFRNEVLKVAALGGKTWKIISSETGAEAMAAGVPNHASEIEQRGMPNHFFTSFFENDKTQGFSYCEMQVDALMTTTIDRETILINNY